jgi:3-isopropylmalate dehydratase small subunit
MEDDVDTDAIFPARYLLLMDKAGLGPCLFHDRRAAAGPQGFVLDQPAYAGARILIARTNFGCGSSREQAVWALVGGGFRCVIAHSFGDIFYANCFKNGLLPIALPIEDVERLGDLAQGGASFDIDLRAQTVRVEDQAWFFELAAQRRDALLSGYDEVDQILADGEPDIAAFEARQRTSHPWLFDLRDHHPKGVCV